jgi:hypothetical protein
LYQGAVSTNLIAEQLFAKKSPFLMHSFARVSRMGGNQSCKFCSLSPMLLSDCCNWPRNLEGMEIWLGIGTFLSLVLAFIGWSLPFGSVAMSVIAFYGARYGWHWELWKAILLAAPGIIFGILVATTGGIAALVAAARGGTTKNAASLPDSP